MRFKKNGNRTEKSKRKCLYILNNFFIKEKKNVWSRKTIGFIAQSIEKLIWSFSFFFVMYFCIILGTFINNF